jgi:hypothetical protein
MADEPASDDRRAAVIRAADLVAHAAGVLERRRRDGEHESDAAYALDHRIADLVAACALLPDDSTPAARIAALEHLHDVVREWSFNDADDRDHISLVVDALDAVGAAAATPELQEPAPVFYAAWSDVEIQEPAEPRWRVGDAFTIDAAVCDLYDGLRAERRKSTGKTPGRSYNVTKVVTGGVHFIDDDGELHFAATKSIAAAGLQEAEPAPSECRHGVRITTAGVCKRCIDERAVSDRGEQQ